MLHKKIKDHLWLTKRIAFAYPKITLSKLDYDTYWKDKRGEAIGNLSDWQEARAKIALDILKETPNVSVMDVGCGDGAMIKYWKEHGLNGTFYGLDISDFALEKAASYGVIPTKADITKPEEIAALPEVDYMVMFETLEHIQDPETLLLAALQKARKGIIFSEPNTGWWPYRLRMLTGRFPMQWRLHPGEHIRFWTKRDMESWLRGIGIKNFKIHFYKGEPGLNKLYPSLFAAAMVMEIRK